MKLRRQQQIERELNGYRAWIDKAGKGWWDGGGGDHRSCRVVGMGKDLWASSSAIPELSRCSRGSVE